MNKMIYLVIIFMLIYCGYQYRRAYMRHQRLCNRIDPIISESQRYTMDFMKDYILLEADDMEIPLSRDDIEFDIREINKFILGETILEEERNKSKFFIVQINYPVEVIGLSLTLSFDVEKPLSSRASFINLHNG